MRIFACITFADNSFTSTLKSKFTRAYKDDAAGLEIELATPSRRMNDVELFTLSGRTLLRVNDESVLHL